MAGGCVSTGSVSGGWVSGGMVSGGCVAGGSVGSVAGCVGSVAGGSVGFVSSSCLPVFSLGFCGWVGSVPSVASVDSVGSVTSEGSVDCVVSASVGSVAGTVVSGGAVVCGAPVDSVTGGLVSNGSSCWVQPMRPRSKRTARVRLRIFFIWHTSFQIFQTTLYCEVFESLAQSRRSGEVATYRREECRHPGSPTGQTDQFRAAGPGTGRRLSGLHPAAPSWQRW